MITDMNRAGLIHCARVYLREAKSRGRSPFAFTLLTWAGNARRLAMAIQPAPSQGDFFGGTANGQR